MIPTGVNAAAPKTLVLGLGKTGLSCARYLSAKGVQVAIADTREQPPSLPELQAEMPDYAVFLGPFDEALLAAVERVVVSPGIPLSTPLVRAAAAQGIEVIGDIELFARVASAPVVAITGSNGKSTVTTLLGEMARANGIRVAVGGNLGTPALDLLAEDVELYVLELSSFQLESTCSLHPAVATVLNVSPDHMDRYPDLAAYAEAKARIFSGAGIGVFNADDAIVAAMGGSEDVWWFTLGEPGDDKCFGVRDHGGAPWIQRGDRPLLAVSSLRMPGRHNVGNALAALAMGTVLGLDEPVMCSVLQSFGGLPHRTEFVAERAGVRWYNDSKATNVGAAVAALDGLVGLDDGMVVLIAGGQCKEADFSHLAVALRRGVRAVVLIGEDASEIAGIVPQGLACEHADSLDAAVDAAARLAKSGDRVLLSPACASFDMFDSYVHRGDVFKAAVRRLVA